MTPNAPPAPAEDDAGGPTVLQPPGWPRPRGYANGMAGQGRIVVTGGVVGWDAAGRFPEGLAAQARVCFANIRAILAEGGAEPRHLVRLTWYVVDVEAYAGATREIGRAYREVFGSHYPAMAVIGVVRLVEPEALIEIEATAIVP